MADPSAPSLAWLHRWRTLAAAAFLGMAGLAHAQATPDDPPDRVARLSYVAGDVGLLPAGAQDWSDAGVNRPLTEGDRLAAAPDARAELELDGAVLRIDGSTDVGFLRLDDALAQVELTQGTLAITVRRLDAGQSYEIDTPTLALVLDQPGSFRIDVDADGTGTRVTARAGAATAYGEQGAERRLVAGRSYRFDDASLNTVVLTDLAGDDAFDAWSADRDRRYQVSSSGQYVSEDVIGYQDLDRYGDWRSDPDYGRVWYPRDVAGDWAPYREGHWSYIRPWGWTWVDDSPWGFAPYHYGRWAFVRDRWCWVPGPVAIRPVYAPALVVFIGGSGWNLSPGNAPVGWFPLGPGEIYDPWYGGSFNYFTRINVTNIRFSRHHHHDHDDMERRLHRHYDRHRRGLPPPVRAERYAHHDARGVTAVSASRFAEARPVGRSRLQLAPRQLHDAPALGRMPAPRPAHRGAGAPDRTGHRVAAAGFERAVITRHAPPVVPGMRRVTFAQPRAGRPRAISADPRPAPARQARAGQTSAMQDRWSRSRPALPEVTARGQELPDPRTTGALRSARFAPRVADRAAARAAPRIPDTAGPRSSTQPGTGFIDASVGRPRPPRTITRSDRPFASAARAADARPRFARHAEAMPPPARAAQPALRPARPQPRFEGAHPRAAPAQAGVYQARRQAPPSPRQLATPRARPAPVRTEAAHATRAAAASPQASRHRSPRQLDRQREDR